ncbi:MAG TPA: polysaccharide deacetylase family protein [Woeseiaceae bacterium]
MEERIDKDEVPMQHLKHSLERARTAGARTGRALAGPLRTRYPGFLFGLPLPAGEVPIFNYHEVTRAELETDLAYLRENGYATLCLDEFVRAARSRRRRRAVLLTFDDAWSSFWTVAYPLLREYRMRAELFAPTHWVDGNGPAGMFMTWDQVRECAASGFVEVESHAFRHALVHTSSQLAGFASPATRAATHFFNWPMRDGDGAAALGPPPVGTPIHHALPLLSATRRYVESTAAVRACRRLVEARGAAFFDSPAADTQLRACYDAANERHPGRWASEDELERERRREFDVSRERFCAELGYAPRYFAFPWMLGNDRSLELAARQGLEAVFGVGVDFRAARRPGLPVPVYGRYKSDWLRCLPGKGRVHALPVLAGKLRHLGTPDSLAH